MRKLKDPSEFRGAQVRYGGQQISFKLDAFVSYGSSDPITLARIAIRYSGVPPTTPQKRHLHTLDSSVMRLILSSTHWSRDHFAKKNVALAIHGALAAALSAVGSFQRQISFAAPFWCGGRAGREVLCALALARPACRAARRLLTSCAPDELLCGRQFCGGWTPRRALRGDSARYVAIRGVARSSVLPGFVVRRRRRLSGQGRHSFVAGADATERGGAAAAARRRHHGDAMSNYRRPPRSEAVDTKAPQ